MSSEGFKKLVWAVAILLAGGAATSPRVQVVVRDVWHDVRVFSDDYNNYTSPSAVPPTVTVTQTPAAIPPPAPAPAIASNPGPPVQVAVTPAVVPAPQPTLIRVDPPPVLVADAVPAPPPEFLPPPEESAITVIGPFPMEDYPSDPVPPGAFYPMAPEPIPMAPPPPYMFEPDPGGSMEGCTCG